MFCSHPKTTAKQRTTQQNSASNSTTCSEHNPVQALQRCRNNRTEQRPQSGDSQDRATYRPQDSKTHSEIKAKKHGGSDFNRVNWNQSQSTIDVYHTHQECAVNTTNPQHTGIPGTLEALNGMLEDIMTTSAEHGTTKPRQHGYDHTPNHSDNSYRDETQHQTTTDRQTQPPARRSRKRHAQSITTKEHQKSQTS